MKMEIVQRNFIKCNRATETILLHCYYADKTYVLQRVSEGEDVTRFTVRVHVSVPTIVSLRPRTLLVVRSTFTAPGLPFRASTAGTGNWLIIPLCG